ncbi:uncharacterized protein FOMMEDRAFT_26910 [Fomitiporia mediterranea MF3/22]|uniref:uncharacterized protein n=1 Tax=Fomitiporia mediterranea (strain MF3/22) TaxID=694068 RepID=UPI00044073F4|nr:uncharacterized protein FOMMEDRAFT_26910 [Fomitiporia mediterranea MF3/22]EJD06170.1 hypothetical protein FOMMEDRAFT_26910 [Fomitiporia mediterranea MF3/22]
MASSDYGNPPTALQSLANQVQEKRFSGKKLGEIVPGMTIWTKNPESGFRHRFLQVDGRLPNEVKKKKHNELVLTVNSNCVTTVGISNFGCSASLSSKGIPSDKWKYFVPISPTTKESSDQLSPIHIEGYYEGGWVMLVPCYIPFDENGNYTGRESSIDGTTLGQLYSYISVVRPEFESFIRAQVATVTEVAAAKIQGEVEHGALAAGNEILAEVVTTKNRAGQCVAQT